ncbi:MAG: hypothetical protein LBE89_01130 [Helicobacteraceae bacterium]|jgi:hypothetical protein|nr:hypothetical protein [Helicobacteraceae bacterium]
MQTLRARVEGKRLNTIIKLPAAFLNKTLEIDVYLDEDTPTQTKNEDKSSTISFDSFGMWKDRADMTDVESYTRNIRNGRRFDC